MANYTFYLDMCFETGFLCSLTFDLLTVNLIMKFHKNFDILCRPNLYQSKPFKVNAVNFYHTFCMVMQHIFKCFWRWCCDGPWKVCLGQFSVCVSLFKMVMIIHKCIAHNPYIHVVASTIHDMGAVLKWPLRKWIPTMTWVCSSNSH